MRGRLSSFKAAHRLLVFPIHYAFLLKRNFPMTLQSERCLLVCSCAGSTCEERLVLSFRELRPKRHAGHFSFGSLIWQSIWSGLRQTLFLELCAKFDSAPALHGILHQNGHRSVSGWGSALGCSGACRTPSCCAKQLRSLEDLLTDAVERMNACGSRCMAQSACLFSTETQPATSAAEEKRRRERLTLARWAPTRWGRVARAPAMR